MKKCLLIKTALCSYRRYVQTLSSLKEIFSTIPENGRIIKTSGWVKSVRDHKDLVFLHVTDGSCVEYLQVVLSQEKFTNDISYGSCVELEGTIAKSIGPKQPVELLASNIKVLGNCDTEEYPFKVKTRHTVDYIRQFLHIRPRSREFSSVLRVRNAMTHAIHSFFQNNDFIQVHTPILTTNDCEGGCETFQVEPADSRIMEKLMQSEPQLNLDDNNVAKKFFFGSPTYLTVSAQLHLECLASAFRKVYTFGPTFRAENSHTRHHLSEFQMVEAELSFITTLDDLMLVIENLVKFAIEETLMKCNSDIDLIWQSSKAKKQKDIIRNLLSSKFLRLSYTDAVEILTKSSKKFDNPLKWGDDLHKEHERYIVSHFGNVPVFVTDYPKLLKPFYARTNEDGRTVAAVDLLAPDVGEICGGSLREERLENLMRALPSQQQLQWYLDLRRFGSVPHGGFGLGFERLIQMMLGISNIQDVIPFPRTARSCRM